MPRRDVVFLAGPEPTGQPTRRFSSQLRAVYASLGPTERGLTVRAAAADKPAEILIYDEIGFWGVTAGDFAAALKQVGAGPVNVRINSPGGDVFDGLAIHNLMRAHAGGVTTTVDGLAASAASIIALAGSSVTMADNSMMMIHRASCLAMGNSAELTALVGTLDKIDGQLASIYAAKTGKPDADMAALMAAETWFTAAEAKDQGLADTVAKAGKAKNSAPPTPTATAADVFNEADRDKMRMRLRLAEAAL